MPSSNERIILNVKFVHLVNMKWGTFVKRQMCAIAKGEMSPTTLSAVFLFMQSLLLKL